MGKFVCDVCDGVKVVVVQGTQDAFGNNRAYCIPCPSCKGIGEIFTDPSRGIFQTRPFSDKE